ncbi:hypothetical protein T08_11611 [Trichinella sp. T8]|nr:hypothetical protein T08_11611 [Trichinella sp. T8]
MATFHLCSASRICFYIFCVTNGLFFLSPSATSSLIQSIACFESPCFPIKAASKSIAPRAAAEVLHNMYVDHLATSCESLNEARKLAAQQDELMASGGSQRMPLEDAGNLFGSQEGPSDLYLSGHSTPRRPRFQAPAAAHGIHHIRPASLFGPIHGKGQDLIPVSMTARDVLGRTLARGRGMTVGQGKREMKELPLIKVPCTLVPVPLVQVKRVELHAFCDTSELAYGTVVYLRVETCAQRALVNLVTAKTRVAPIKRLSLPL